MSGGIQAFTEVTAQPEQIQRFTLASGPLYRQSQQGFDALQK